jgi:hypothetical protein
MPKLSFGAQVAAFAGKAGDAVDAVFRESARDVVAEMQRPGHSVASTKAAIGRGIGSRRDAKRQGPVASSGAGGNLPVDTGFLRASLLASTSAMPQINAAARPVAGQTYGYNEARTDAVITAAEIGSTLYFGYTAAYAAAVEYGTRTSPPRRFVALAAQNWQAIVGRKAAEVKNRLGL